MIRPILCVPRRGLPPACAAPRMVLPLVATVFERDWLAARCEWIDRQQAETDERYVQIIPYCIIVEQSSGHLLAYRRSGSETRLHGRISCGLGGHVDAPDATDGYPMQWIMRGLARELHEECGLTADAAPAFQGLIAETESPAGRVHLGAVFSATIDRAVLQPSDEIADCFWADPEELWSISTELELWSILALELCKPGEPPV